MVKLSVVVAFYNVAEYLAAALESIARQDLDDLEIIMVNDGSTDGSSLIAKSYAVRDHRFRLIEQENAGLGPARNAGTSQATGKYLAFADGDDVVAPHAYALLTESLEKTGSDIASGAIRRFTAAGIRPARLYEAVFEQAALRTHVSKFPLLTQDRVACNKVFRRSFWDTHEFVFPAGLYEDAPLTVRAHVLASAVDVLADVVYYWRVREESITGRYRELANIEQRMATVREVDRFLAANAPGLKAANDESVLRRDIRLLVRAYEESGQQERDRIAELAAAHLETVDPAVYQAVPMSDRLRAYLLGQQRLPELLEVLRFERSGEALAAPVIRGDGGDTRWFARYPFFGDPAHGIPADMYDVTSEMTLSASVDSVEWRGRKLRITGHAYIHRVSSATPSECQLGVTLRGRKHGQSIRLPVSRLPRPDVTAASGQAAVSYDWSGFAAEVTARRLAALARCGQDEDWELRVEVAGSGLRREGPVSSVQPGSARWPEGRWAARGNWLQPGLDRHHGFVIRSRQITCHATACLEADGMLAIEGWSSEPLTSGASVRASQGKSGRPAIEVAARPVPASRPGWPRRLPRRPGPPPGAQLFHAQIPVSALVSGLDPGSPIDRVIHTHDEFSWSVSFTPGAGKPGTRLSIARGAAGARVAAGPREVTAVASLFGTLSLLERTVRPVVTAVEWPGDGRLVLRGDYRGQGGSAPALLLRQPGSGRELSVPVQWDGAAFTAVLESAGERVTGPGGDAAALASGNWQLLAPAGADGSEVSVALDRLLLPSLPGCHQLGSQEAGLDVYSTDALRLRVTPG